MTGGLVVVLVALVVVVLGPRLASARAVPGTTAYVARKGCPAPHECCRYPEHSGKFRACCDAYGCCPDCDDIFVYRGHGPYDVRQDCVGAYECCLHPFLSEEFHRCCFEHGCCPVCGSVSDGCCFNNVMYSWSSVVLALPRCCLDLVCGARLSGSSPPYLTAVIVPIYYPPTSEDQLCDPVKNDYCVEPKGIIRADGSEWLETPCNLCRCDNGRVSCRNVRPQTCPPAPHPHCREVPGDCCPSWDCYKGDWRIWSYRFSGILKPDHRSLRTCIDEDGRVHDFGEQWWDLRDPCVFHTCTEDGITRTRRGCPPLPPSPPPHQACHLFKSYNECCFTWRCSICTDEDGTVHNLGDRWLDPQDECIYYVCTEDGIRRALGDCSHLSFRPRQACLLTDDEECCQPECSTCVDEDGEPREIGDEWEDPHDSCFYYTCTDDGISRAPKDCPELPSRPHQDCHLFKEDNECCQTWRCSGCVYDGVFHGYGEGWQEPTNPCIHYSCADNNISKAYENCPATPTKPHPRCQLIRLDGRCCMEWKCPTCPDPHSFDRVCTRSVDQCQSDLECPPGHHCCLVTSCGKECVPDDDHPCYTTPMCQRLGGQCSDACGRDEGLITGVCSSDDCVCCVPEANSCKFETMACRERGGRCDSTCGREEDPVQELCLTDDCLCCVPKHRPCLNTSFCNLLAGRCARNCSLGENAFSGMCASSDCVCCVPEQRPCHNSSRCLQRGGRCASDCGRGENPVLGLCQARDCICCVPEPINRCDIDTFGCRMKGGHCDRKCGSDEDPVKHLCNTDDCLCCVPMCSIDPFACRSKGGHCSKTCGRDEVPVKHLCDTESCLCCVPGKQRQCHDTSLCLGLGGECASDCGRGENPVQGVCDSRDCVCCVPGFDRCTAAIGCSIKGGHCDRMCGRDEDPVKHLCNSNDCLCCLPRRRQCQTTNLCHGMGGACANDCSKGKKPIPSVCENRDCICCVPELPPCDTTTFACRSSGGHCALRCSRDEDPVRQLCTTGDCLCCVPKPVRCQDSILCYKYLGGQCARDCGRGETPIDGVCETRHCVCCVPGVQN